MESNPSKQLSAFSRFKNLNRTAKKPKHQSTDDIIKQIRVLSSKYSYDKDTFYKPKQRKKTRNSYFERKESDRTPLREEVIYSDIMIPTKENRLYVRVGNKRFNSMDEVTKQLEDNKRIVTKVKLNSKKIASMRKSARPECKSNQFESLHA